MHGAPPVPAFKPAATVKGWEKQRRQIRATAWELLGKLPAGPKAPVVTTLTREDQGDYVLEKFTFDNGAQEVSSVPSFGRWTE